MRQMVTVQFYPYIVQYEDKGLGMSRKSFIMIYTMKKYIIESIGTFFLVLTVMLTGSPISIGAVLVALVYMGGYVSGAHYNPAVTFGLLVSGNISWKEAKNYMAAQLFGGFVAAAVFTYIKSFFFTLSPGENVSFSSAFLTEVIFTFLLVSVVHHVAVNPKVKGNQYYGLAIGMTLLAAAFSGGPISGGAFNPAVGVSPIIYDVSSISLRLGNILLYSAGPLLGGALAGWLYKHLT